MVIRRILAGLALAFTLTASASIEAAVAQSYQFPPGPGPVPSSGGSATPSGPAGGDLAGTYPNPTVKASVGLTGTPTAPTATTGDNSTTIATTAFVKAQSYGTGTVTSVASGAGLTGGPITTTGTLAIDFTRGNTWSALTAFNLNAASAPTPVAGTVLQLTGADGGSAFEEMNAFGGTPIFTGRRADGTGASPTAVASGDVLAGFSARPYDGSAYATSSTGNMQAVASETFTTARHGTDLVANCTAITTLTTAECGRFKSTGLTTSTLALGGATIGTDALGVTGTSTFSGLITTGVGGVSLVDRSTNAVGVPTLFFSGATGYGVRRSSGSSLTWTGGGADVFTYNTGQAIFRSAVSMGWSNTGNSTDTQDVFFTRCNAACFQHGAADVDTAPVAQTIRTQGALAGGTSNVNGANLTVIVSPGKGTGTGGSFIVQVAPAGSSGTVVNTPVTAMTILSDKSTTFGGTITSAANIVLPSTNVLNFSGSGGIFSSSDGWIGIQNNAGTNKVILGVPAAATIQHGAADAASPVAQIEQVQSVSAGTSAAGANWTLIGSKGTGGNAGGSVIIQTSPADTTHATTAASGTGTVATIAFSGTNVYTVGGTITVAGVTPSGYNGVGQTVTASSAGSVTFTNATTGAQTVAGTVIGVTTVNAPVTALTIDSTQTLTLAKGIIAGTSAGYGLIGNSGAVQGMSASGSATNINANTGGVLNFGTASLGGSMANFANGAIRLGAPGSATPATMTVTVGDSARGGTDSNVAGANGTVNSGLGTGTGTPSTFALQSPIAAASGTTAQTYATGFAIQNTHHQFGGTAPALSSCGGSPAIDANATDSSGTVTAGTAATSCTITFNKAYTVYNHCRVTFQSSLAAEAYSYTLSAITITATSLTGNLDYDCDGK